MKTIMVRYRTKSAAHGDTNEQLVRAVFEELAAHSPERLRYASYRLADGVSFMHIASVEDRNTNPLTSLPAFKTFQAALGERCDEPPVITELSVVGAYGVGG
jgi:hypothetical protein